MKKKKDSNVAFLNNTMQLVTHELEKTKPLSKNDNKGLAEKFNISDRTFLALNLHIQMNARQL